MAAENLTPVSLDMFPGEFCFPSAPLSREESQFPLAFVIILHNDLQQALHLLQSIYWPQNLYCVTYDEKSDNVVKNFVQKLPGCFPNVILPEKHELIYWGQIGVLQAAVNCMRVLQRKSHPWRYAQILSGHDFPLRTNAEMVKILKIFNGSNDSELARGQAFRSRWHTEFVPHEKPVPSWWDTTRTLEDYSGKVLFDINRVKSPPPGDVTIYKGSFASTLSREFVNFAINADFPKAFLEWLNDTYIADEQYWATLIHNSKVGTPGGFPGNCLNHFGNSIKPFVSRYHVWPDSIGRQCYGKYHHGSCVFGIRDLPQLVQANELVAHKVFLNYQPLLFFCLKYSLDQRTNSLTEKTVLNLDFYKKLPAVRYQNLAKSSKTENCDFLESDKREIFGKRYKRKHLRDTVKSGRQPPGAL